VDKGAEQCIIKKWKSKIKDFSTDTNLSSPQKDSNKTLITSKIHPQMVAPEKDGI
jgi:hypothetical protein